MNFLRLLPVWFLIMATSSLLILASGRSSQQESVPEAYLGFDRNEYPGDDALATLRKTFSFTSYWLGPPPGEKSNTWLGKRAILQSHGFGFVVLFNGREGHKLKSEIDARQKGALDAQTAAKLALQEGFPSGTVIFLDIEEGGRLPATYHEYLKAWIDELDAARFRAGVYCSAVPVDEGADVRITTAEDIQSHLVERKLVFWVFNDACPPSPGCTFRKDPPAPSSSGSNAAAVWQYAQSPRRKDRTSRCTATYAADGNCYAPRDSAHKWFLDANVASSPDPSGIN